MKKLLLLSVVVLMTVGAGAELAYDFANKGATFDGASWGQVLLSDGGFDLTMTVSGVGGDLNSNAGGIGVGDDQIDGIFESIAISFDRAVDFISIDLSGLVGSSTADAANLTLGSLEGIDLYTGVAGFEGTPDLYTPAGPVRINIGETIILTGSSSTSSFDLEKMTFAAVPEPATFSMIAIGGLLTLLVRRIKRD